MRIKSRVFKLVVYASIAPVIAGLVVVLSFPAALAVPRCESPDSSPGLSVPGAEPELTAKADAMVSTIESHLYTQSYAAARQAALELTQLYPRYLKGWMLLGYCQSLTSDFALSNEAYDRALELGAEETAVHSRKAYNYVRLGEYDRAARCYRSVLEVNPKDAEVLKQLGYVESKQGNYHAAARYCEKAMELAPRDVDIVLSLARIETKRGGNGRVRELLEKALLIEPNNTEALGKLGVVCMKEKNYRAALDALSRLVALEPENAKAHRNIGAAHYQLGDKRGALVAFERAIALGGDADDLYGPLADCYLAEAKKSEALAMIREGIDKGVQRAWLYSLWGKVLEEGKNYDGAIEKFSEAARLQEGPWSDYAKKQIARQSELKKRGHMMASQMQGAQQIQE